MAIHRAVLAATVLLSSCEALLAEDYVIGITGAAGTAVGGTCLSVTANKPTSHDASGTVPLTLEFSGDIVSCAIQRKSGAGNLRVVIKGSDGRVVAESSEVQPFGIVMASGR